ncbi:hypothetical protein PN836_013065 [Ningiella sp. W23]|uniref:hypothetical protein n=1 Tax=Ningiella sp. W23 TaxID=3023715 RepID=UPI003756A9FA
MKAVFPIASCLFGLYLLCMNDYAHALIDEEQDAKASSISAFQAKPPIPSNAERSDSYKKILFVGNSFSFYNNGIHNQLGSLIRAQGEWERGENRMRLLTLSGGHIHEHLDGLANQLKHDPRPWQAVVLQGHSNEPISKRKQDRFDESLSKAIQIIKERQLTPILFMTWGYKGEPDMAQALRHAYEAQAAKHQVAVVPVGLAFQRAEKVFPDINLFVKDVLGMSESAGTERRLTYRDDIKHPSAAGTYLAACVFYASLYQRSPEGNVFTAGLKNTDAHKLQTLAWETVSEYFNYR